MEKLIARITKKPNKNLKNVLSKYFIICIIIPLCVWNYEGLMLDEKPHYTEV